MPPGFALLWELDSPDLQSEILAAAVRYRQLYQEPATLIRMHPLPPEQSITAPDGVAVEFSKTIQPGTMHVGRP